MGVRGALMIQARFPSLAWLASPSFCLFDNNCYPRNQRWAIQRWHSKEGAKHHAGACSWGETCRGERFVILLAMKARRKSRQLRQKAGDTGGRPSRSVALAGISCQKQLRDMKKTGNV